MLGYQRAIDFYMGQGVHQAEQEMNAAEELRSLARDGLRKIAVRGLKASSPGMDAIFYFYLPDALRLFREKSMEKV